MRLISLLIILCFFALVACSGLDDPKTLVNNGIALFEQGEYTKAKLEFRSAIQQDKSIPEAYYYLALINEHKKSYKNMLRNLERAVKLKPDYLEARLKLGKLLLLSNDMEKAQEQMEKILEISSTDKDGLVFKAMLLNRQGKPDEAKAIIEPLVTDNPDFAEAVTLSAMLLINEKKYDEAQARLLPLIEEGSDHVPLYMVKILLDAKKNDYDAVIKDYQDLIHHYPENDDLKYALIKIYVQTQKQQEAEQLLKALIEQKPDEIAPKLKYLDLLYYYENTQGGNRVNAQLDTYIQNYQDDPDTLTALSGWMLGKRMYEKGEKVLESIDTTELKKHKQAKIKLTLAQLAFQQRDMDKANQIIAEILSIKNNFWPAKILKSKVFVAQRQYDEAKELLNKVSWANPKDDEPISLLAQIDLIQNDPVSAAKKFNEALKLNPANKLALQYIIKEELKKKNYEYADELIGKAIMVEPKNMNLLRKATQVRLLNKDWPGAELLIDYIGKQSDGRLEAVFLQGKMLQIKNECAKAIPMFEDLLAQEPGYTNALEELARCREIMKQRPELMQFLLAFNKKHPKNISSTMMLSDLYFAEKNVKGAENILKNMLSVDPHMPQVYIKLSRLYRFNNETDNAIHICKEGLQLLPNNLAISLELASIYEITGKYEDAIAIYENLLLIHPNMNLIANNLAALLTDHRSDNQSKQRAFELAKRFEKLKQPYFLDTYAWILVGQDDLTQAVSILEEISRNVPNEPIFKYHLGVAYYKQGNLASAKIELKNALELGQKRSYFAEAKAAKKLYDELLGS